MAKCNQLTPLLFKGLISLQLLTVLAPPLSSTVLNHPPAPLWKSQIAHFHTHHPVSGIHFETHCGSLAQIIFHSTQFIIFIISTFTIHHSFTVQFQDWKLVTNNDGRFARKGIDSFDLTSIKFDSILFSHYYFASRDATVQVPKVFKVQTYYKT